MDPFSMLGVEARFDLDEQALAARQKELSLSLHPDRIASRSSLERRAALGRAIEVNQAYRLLKDPLTRATALLQRWGVSLDEENQPRVAPDLLMAMMELREELRDAANALDEAKVRHLVEETREKEQRALAELSLGLAQLAQSPSSDPDGVLRALSALRYLRRFFDEAGAVLDEF